MQRDHFVDDVLAMAKEIKVEPSQILFMRDNDPKSRDIASEKDMGLNVMAQSPKSPDMNVLDFSLWNYAVQKLTEEEFAWEKKNPGETFHESIDEFQKRLKRILLKTPEAVVRKAMEDTPRRLAEIVKSGGEMIR